MASAPELPDVEKAHESSSTSPERGPATPEPTLARTKWSRVGIGEHFLADVSAKHADTLLLLCTFISGLVDSSMFDAYNTFVSMQTGNTIFLGLGASGQNTMPNGWARSLLAIVGFTIGCLFFSRFGMMLGPLRRFVLAGSFLLQAVIIFIAAGIIQGGLIAGDTPAHLELAAWNDLAPVTILAFQSAGQIVASRQLQCGELPTVVVTSLLCDLWSDPGLVSGVKTNAKRNRRAIAFVLTLLGAIIGGWMCRGTQSVKAVLWLVGALKMVIVLAWVFWAEKSVAPLS